MTVVDRVQANLLANPYAGTNRRINETLDTWVRRAQIACYSCGSTNIGGLVAGIGWLCDGCVKKRVEESRN